MLLEAGAITGDQLARAVAQRFGLDHVDLTIYKPDVGALNLITPQAARRLNAVPIGCDDAGHPAWSRWRTRRTCSRSTT